MARRASSVAGAAVSNSELLSIPKRVCFDAQLVSRRACASDIAAGFVHTLTILGAAILQTSAPRNTIKAISQSGEVSSPAPSEAGFGVDTTNNVKVRRLCYQHN